MAIDPVNPLGWGPKDPITSGQMNGIDQRLVRAVDGVQGGSYAGPVNFTAATLTGTSSVNTTGSVQSKGLVQGSVVALGVTSVTGIADGATVQLIGLTSTFHLTMGAPGAATVTLEFSFVLANAIYFVALNHVATLFGRLTLKWAGNGMTHRFTGGADVDGQPTPGSGLDMWSGLAVSANEIWWTITRGLA